MNVQTFQVGKLFYAQIDGLYSDQELKDIQKEIEFLETIKQDPNQTNTAVNNGVPLKDGHGIFVDDVYKNRCHSKILTLNRKLFDSSVTNKLVDHNCFYSHIKQSTKDSTLLNFYGNDGNYKPHADTSIFTALTFFKIGFFQGGNLSFTEHGVSIEPVVNRTVIFPGCVLHTAEQVLAEEGNYRVTMAQFIGYEC